MGNKKGSFTVKSAYYVVRGLMDAGTTGEKSSNHQASPFWKRIWQLNVTLKVKFFAWMVCLDGLPRMLNLWHRGLNTFGFCQICDKDLESINHALLHCNHAQKTWACWNDCPMDLSSSAHDFISITTQFLEKGSSIDLDLFYMVT